MRTFLILFCLLFIGCQPEYKEKNVEGEIAFKAGIPPQANPYIGQQPYFAKLWLDGYIAALDKSKK